MLGQSDCRISGFYNRLVTITCSCLNLELRSTEGSTEGQAFWWWRGGGGWWGDPQMNRPLDSTNGLPAQIDMPAQIDRPFDRHPALLVVLHGVFYQPHKAPQPMDRNRSIQKQPKGLSFYRIIVCTFIVIRRFQRRFSNAWNQRSSRIPSYPEGPDLLVVVGRRCGVKALRIL